MSGLTIKLVSLFHLIGTFGYSFLFRLMLNTAKTHFTMLSRAKFHYVFLNVLQNSITMREF